MMYMLITENELCKKLNVGRVFLWNCRQNGMPFVRLGKKVIRYDYEKVLQWFEENAEKVGDNVSA